MKWQEKAPCLQFVSSSYCSLSVSCSVIFAFTTALIKYVYLREESNLCNNFILKRGGVGLFLRVGLFLGDYRTVFIPSSIVCERLLVCFVVKPYTCILAACLGMMMTYLSQKNSVGLSLVRWATYVWEKSVEPHLPKRSKPKCYLSTAHAYNIT